MREGDIMHKFGKILLSIVIAFSLLIISFSVTALAQNTAANQNTKTDEKWSENIGCKGKDGNFKHGPFKKHRDPVKALEEKKEKIRELQKQGKISEEEANEMIKKIDEKIKLIEEFKKLPAEKKKEVLISKFKERIEEKVKEGKLTRVEADKIIEKYTEKLNKLKEKDFQNFKYNGKIFRDKKNKREKPKS